VGDSASGTGVGYGIPLLDTSAADPARVYDYWLGGKDHFAADRRAAEAGVDVFPGITASVRANRAFLARAVRHLAKAGIRQFLDIGAGLPSADNTHEVAQAVAPESRVVYVDHDPVVLLHAQALHTGSAAGAIRYVDADLRDPERILREAAVTLDFARPTAVLLFGILHFIEDDEAPRQIVDTLTDAVPAGSFLAISHLASDLHRKQLAAITRAVSEHISIDVAPRGRDEVSGFFRGLELLEPGVVPVSRWRPRAELEANAPALLWGGVARKR
jgi:O-methyltransferase involved in polyketide biosynthesis